MRLNDDRREWHLGSASLGRLAEYDCTGQRTMDQRSEIGDVERACVGGVSLY